MRMIVLAGALAAAFIATQASAQTTTSAPFCLQKNPESQALECKFASMAECERSKTGNNEKCIRNPGSN